MKKTKKPLSRREKISIVILSATLSVAVISVLYYTIRRRKNRDDDTECNIEQVKSVFNASHSSDSISAPPVENIFNSSRLNEDNQAQDSLAQLHDLAATKSLPDGVKFISYKTLIDLIKNNTSKYVIFDLREIDFNGGHIKHSIHLSDKLFYDEIANIFNKYHNIQSLIFQCMDGSLRSIECIEYYSKARKQVIKYYDKETKLSYYYKYTLKIQHDAHKTVMRSIKWDNKQWMERFVEKKKIVIDFNQGGKQEMFANLMKQKLYVVFGGFFDFLNSSISDKGIHLENDDIITDFDSNHWEQLTVMGKKKLYHKTEYYTTRRSNPLRKTQTKQCF